MGGVWVRGPKQLTARGERLVGEAQHELPALALDAVGPNDNVSMYDCTVCEGNAGRIFIVGDDWSAHVDGNAELFDSVEEGLVCGRPRGQRLLVRVI